MSTFKISAPGRIVLSGEHLAVYGKQFIVASLNCRTQLEFCEQPVEWRTIRLEFPDINLELDVPLEEVERFFSHVDLAHMYSNPIRLFKYVKHLISINGMWKTWKQRSSLQMFFFLLYSIAGNKGLRVTSFRVRVSSNIPLRAGFGSSSSFVVCLATCFLHWSGLQRGCRGNNTEFNSDELLEIENYATSCEEAMQDYEFALIDNSICISGKMKKCRRIDYINYSMESINMITMRVLLIDSNIYEDKYERMEQIANLKHLIREFQSLLCRLDELTTTMFNTFVLMNNATRDPNLSRLNEVLYRDLEFDIRRYQQVLSNYHLSCPEYDFIVAVARSFGFVGKLTGFQGGYVYILLPLNITESELTNISTYLMRQGFHVIQTSINCDGVRIDN